MGVNERNVQVIEEEVIMQNCPIVFLYGTYLPLAIMVLFVINTMSFTLFVTSMSIL